MRVAEVGIHASLIEGVGAHVLSNLQSGEGVTVSAMDASVMRGTIEADIGQPSNNLPGDEQVRGAWACS
jgi:hypothetical protein